MQHNTTQHSAAVGAAEGLDWITTAAILSTDQPPSDNNLQLETEGDWIFSS